MPGNNNYSQRTQTSTQIRNMYSEGVSYMNIRFFNTNLAFHLYPFMGKDPNGRSQYNMQMGAQTTVNFEGAYALWKAGTDILDGRVQEISLVIPCLNDASVAINRSQNNGVYETTFSITKGGNVIPFKFATIPYQVTENGVTVTKYMESGLGSFVKTIEGYLTGINADRHLNKLTDDFAKIQEQNNQSQPQNNSNQNNWNSSNQNNWNRNRPRNNQNFNRNRYQNNQGAGSGWNNNNNPMGINNYSISQH